MTSHPEPSRYALTVLLLTEIMKLVAVLAALSTVLWLCIEFAPVGPYDCETALSEDRITWEALVEHDRKKFPAKWEGR
jgi:hypothetical protein